MISSATKDGATSPPRSQSISTGTDEIQTVDVSGHHVKDDPNDPSLKRARDGTLLVPQPTDDPDEPLVSPSPTISLFVCFPIFLNPALMEVFVNQEWPVHRTGAGLESTPP